MTINEKSFYQSKQEVREAAGVEFEASGLSKSAPDAGARRAREGQFVDDAAKKWYATFDPLVSIEIGTYPTHCEIRDEWYGGSITVYRPAPEFDWTNEGRKKTIRPGYINASSWQAGGGRSGMTSDDIRRELANRLTMMEYALDKLNEYNAIVLDWTDVDNPFCAARELRAQVESYRAKENEKLRKQNEKSAAKKKQK